MQNKTNPTSSKTAPKAPRIQALLPPSSDPTYTVGKPAILDQRSDITDPCFGKVIEQVGSGYELLKRRYARLHARIASGASACFSDDESPTSDEQEEETKGEATSNSEGQNENTDQKKRTKTKEDIERELLDKGDLYGVLGLEDQTYKATENEIKKGYQKAALKFHPDKLGKKATEDDKEMWLKIQDAYETLCDLPRRRRYDSCLPFDDSTPKEGEWTEETYWEVFQTVFTRNSRFALVKPVPSLGDVSTPLNTVKKFYAYWEDFKSWREFTQYDEYKLEDAQDRHEKRYMEKENKKLRGEHEKKERSRLIKFVQRCRDADPRIQQELVEIEAEKQRKKEQKYGFKKNKTFENQENIRLAAEKIALDEQLKKEAELVKREEGKRKNLAYKASIKELVEVCKVKLAGTQYDKFWVDSILRRCSTIDRITPFIEFLNAREAGAQTIAEFKEFELDYFSSEADRLKRKLEREKEEQKEVVEIAKWSPEETARLNKGITKFPPGTVNRWLTIAEFIGSKSQKEVIHKAKEIAEKRNTDAEERRQKEEEEKLQKEASAKAAKEALANKQKEEAAERQRVASASQAQTAQTNSSEWSDDQQKQMEDGMKTVPASVGVKERWIAISKLVDNKNPKECYERFRVLCAKMKAAKEAGAAK